MGLDISVNQYLKLKSGKLYNLGEVPCHGVLLNDTLWFQNECQFLSDWAKATLKRVNADEYEPDCDSYSGEYHLEVQDVTELIKKLNKALALRYEPGRSKKLKKQLPWLDLEARYYNKNLDDLFYDFRKAIDALAVLNAYAGDSDSTFIMNVS